MITNEGNIFKKNKIKITDKNINCVNLSFQQNLNNNNIYKSLVGNKNLFSKGQKRKRNLSEPNAKYKKLILQKEERNIKNRKTNDKNITGFQNNILKINKNNLKQEELNRFTSNDKGETKKKEKNINVSRNINSNENINTEKNLNTNRNINTDRNINNNLINNAIIVNQPKERKYSSNYNKRKCNCNCDCDCDCKGCFCKIFDIIIILVIDAIIVFVIYLLCKKTEKNPLENIILYHPNIDLDYSDIKNNKLDAHFNKSKNLLRQLQDSCEDFDIKLQENNYQLDKVFDLRFSTLHKTFFVCLIINSFVFVYNFLILLVCFGIMCGCDCCRSFFIGLMVLTTILNVIIILSNYIIFIINMINYRKGNGTPDFLEYYVYCLDDDIIINTKFDMEDLYDKVNELNKLIIVYDVLVFVTNFLICFSAACKRDRF